MQRDSSQDASDDPWPGQLVETLARLDGPADLNGVWSEPLWQTLVHGCAHRWSIPAALGGLGCDRLTLLERYAKLAEGSLTAALVLTQHDAAVRRLAAAENNAHVVEWLGRVARAELFPTVGISHLTTSRRLGDRAVTATPTDRGYVVRGTIPWVTAAERADLIVTGASLDDRRQMLFALPVDRAGVRVEPPFALAALQASSTAEVHCTEVEVAHDEVIAGPSPDVMALPGLAGTGGLETSALALGQASAALVGLERHARLHPEISPSFQALDEARAQLELDLRATAMGQEGAPSSASIRRRANELVLKSTQAYLTACKGAGFLRESDAQRFARQSLFFLVWSCPGPVAHAVMRHLAGVCDTDDP